MYKVYNNLGEAYYYAKEYNKAVEYFKRAIEVNLNNDKAYSGLGVIYYNQKEYDKAIEINPNNDKAFNGLGVVYSNQKEYEKAIEYYKKAVKLNPKYDLACNNLNAVYKKLNKAFFINKDISNLDSFMNKAELHNFKQYKEFNIEFSRNVNIIIGENAIGKTTLKLLQNKSSKIKKLIFYKIIPSRL